MSKAVVQVKNIKSVLARGSRKSTGWEILPPSEKPLQSVVCWSIPGFRRCVNFENRKVEVEVREVVPGKREDRHHDLWGLPGWSRQRWYSGWYSTMLQTVHQKSCRRQAGDLWMNEWLDEFRGKCKVGWYAVLKGYVRVLGEYRGGVVEMEYEVASVKSGIPRRVRFCRAQGSQVLFFESGSILGVPAPQPEIIPSMCWMKWGFGSPVRSKCRRRGEDCSLGKSKVYADWSSRICGKRWLKCRLLFVCTLEKWFSGNSKKRRDTEWDR